MAASQAAGSAAMNSSVRCPPNGSLEIVQNVSCAATARIRVPAAVFLENFVHMQNSTTAEAAIPGRKAVNIYLHELLVVRNQISRNEISE